MEETSVNLYPFFSNWIAFRFLGLDRKVSDDMAILKDKLAMKKSDNAENSTSTNFKKSI